MLGHETHHMPTAPLPARFRGASGRISREITRYFSRRLKHGTQETQDAALDLGHVQRHFLGCNFDPYGKAFGIIGKWGKVFLSKTWESKHQHSFFFVEHSTGEFMETGDKVN